MFILDNAKCFNHIADHYHNFHELKIQIFNIDG